MTPYTATAKSETRFAETATNPPPSTGGVATSVLRGSDRLTKRKIGERLESTQLVPPQFYARLTQRYRVPALQAGGRRFESYSGHAEVV